MMDYAEAVARRRAYRAKWRERNSRKIAAYQMAWRAKRKAKRDSEPPPPVTHVPRETPMKCRG